MAVRKHKLLVIDDVKVQRELCKAILETVGYKVKYIENATNLYGWRKKTILPGGC